MAKHAPVKYVLAGAGISALGLVVLQSLLAQRLERAQIAQMGPEVAFNLRLGELALDRLPPQALARLSGLPLRVGPFPPVSRDGRLQRQALLLQQELCQRVRPCPPVLPADSDTPGLWLSCCRPSSRSGCSLPWAPPSVGHPIPSCWGFRC